MKFVSTVWIVFALFILSCGEADVSSETSRDSLGLVVIHRGSWAVQYDPLTIADIRAELVFAGTASDELRSEVDSINHDSALPDSLRFNMEWPIGASSALIFSVTVPDQGNVGLMREARAVCDNAQVIRPEGLRSVFLSDRTGTEIDTDRASSAVEPPPDVNHHLMVYFQQDSLGNSLEVIDSLVVDFNGSNAESMAFTFIHRDASSVISSTAGIFRRDSIQNHYICFADSTEIYTGVFRNQFHINIPYLDSRGRVSVQSRLTSAYLSGDGYYPISSAPANYTVKMFLPDSIISWTPLERGESQDEWFSKPGGIVGGLPMAIGNYTEKTLFPRYRMLTLTGSPISSLDSIAVERIASVLRSTLDFPSAEFAFIEIINPGGPVVTSAFGGMLFSRGSLENLVDVSSWDENFANGIVPPGCEILIEAAEGMLLQSLQLDEIVSDMLVSWIPLRYFEANTDDANSVKILRDAYLKYYLFNTENLGGDGSSPLIAEYALGDPMLYESPLRSFVTGGKGVIVMEYLNSLRMLNRLPHLLQDFTHASGGNFWLKISSTLRVYSGTEKYDLLRALLYQPGIPQLRVRWREDGEFVLMNIEEIQPGLPFNLELAECQLHFADTTVVRTLTPSTAPGLVECMPDLPGNGTVMAIDLNFNGEIPADFIYTRITNGELE